MGLLVGPTAKSDAESRGGYLATITSAEENDRNAAVPSNNPWIGGTDQAVEYLGLGDW